MVTKQRFSLAMDFSTPLFGMCESAFHSALNDCRAEAVVVTAFSPQRQKSKSKQKDCGDEVGTPTSITVTQKLFLVKLKALATNIGGVEHGDENMDKPKTAIDKRKLHVEKLKELSLRHV